MELKTGSAVSTLDDKGRVNIPVRFREQYQGELAMTWGIDRCIYIMTPSAWENFEKWLRKRKKLIVPRKWRVLENKYLNQAMEVEIDKVGRIAIPPTFRTYASLTKDCMVINNAEGCLSVWDYDTFNAYLAENNEVSQEPFDELGSQDIFSAEQDEE